MTCSIQEPVRRDVSDRQHVWGNSRQRRLAPHVSQLTGAGKWFFGCNIFSLRLEPFEKKKKKKKSLKLMLWSCVEVVDKRAPEHAHPAAHYEKWISSSPVACYLESRNGGMLSLSRLREFGFRANSEFMLKAGIGKRTFWRRVFVVVAYYSISVRWTVAWKSLFFFVSWPIKFYSTLTRLV